MAIGRPAAAVAILEPLVAHHQGNTLLYAALGQAQMAAKEPKEGLATFETALELFPRNVPLSIRYAEALMSANRARDAHMVLLDLFNNVEPTPPQIRLTAMAASAAGDAGDAYYYMSEYHIANGDLTLSVQQLQLALTAPNLTVVQKERYQARLDEIRDYLATGAHAARQQQPVAPSTQRRACRAQGLLHYGPVCRRAKPHESTARARIRAPPSRPKLSHHPRLRIAGAVETRPARPLERMNRVTFAVNEKLDRAFAKPWRAPIAR
jgi:tetratricopeptide (TPR) repeat protein